MFWFWAQRYQIICAVEEKYVFPIPLGQNKETFVRNSFWDTARLLICFSLLQTWRGRASTLNFTKASLKIIHKHLECKYPTMYTSSPLNNTSPKRWIHNPNHSHLTPHSWAPGPASPWRSRWSRQRPRCSSPSCSTLAASSESTHLNFFLITNSAPTLLL